MTKKEEYIKVCKLIKYNIRDAKYGIFNTRNIIGDPMCTLFKGKYIQLDICYYYGYYEVFGLSDEEYDNIRYFYKVCVMEVDDE